ncbi:complement factor H-like isoform X2 [Chanodichthys erythropterus]|uniref:complement factor H-like isoform X2 n=1 Tax=Chanodichthys erythropterus TaxID=933992 RepID=UPI00351EA703
MRVPVQIISFSCFLFSVTVVRGQAKQKLCPYPSVENGLIHTISSNEKEIFYTCNTGYKPFRGNWWDSVTCSGGSWSEEPRCIREEECGAFPSVHHGKLQQTKQTYNDGDETEFKCDPGFKPTPSPIRCVSGAWETPVCEVDVRCDIPPKVENALITSKPEEFYGDGSNVTYACRSSFLMTGKSTVFCRSGTWEKAPTCKEATCPLNPADEDLIMKRSPDIEGPVKPGQKIKFSCNREGLKLEGQREITCQSNGEWSSPFPKCEEVMCVANLTANMRSNGHPGPKISVRPGATITLSCVGRELQGQNKIRCLPNGKWNSPFPKCVGGKCGTPPNVNFADTTEMTKKEYNSEDRVEYTCFNKYTLDQRHPYSKYLTCEDGEWRGNIKCLKPCSVSVEKMDERGIELRWGGRQKIFSPHGDRITFSYCLREDIKYENTEPAAKASYSDGETVRLYCMTGFTGVYRLKCEEGKWKTTIERKCAKKKCSHPGDTPNGDFKLTAGSEFVFGATALYTCKKGFEMTSRINQRTCRAQGWDNTVPVCEAVKCPAIRTNAFVTASGNTEEGSYGDVIHFECVSADKKIDGSSDIHCTETGDWSDSVPTCKEITCTAPVITNGFVVEPAQEYQKDAILKYRCSPGFKAREGIPRCAKFGWTLNPECDEVTCELKSRFGVQKINPEGKTLFRAEESVEITCTERYRIIGTKQITRSFTCQENGEWDHEPVCEVIRCEVPRDQHVYNPHYYFSGEMTLGTKKSYYCYDEGQYNRGVATCTRDGWTPKPLCAEKTCAAPNIENAEILGGQTQKYSKKSKIKYQCYPGFEPEQPVEITCNSQTEWTGIRPCHAKQKLCKYPSVENGFHTLSSTEEKIFYSCDTGYKPFSGNWWDSVTCSGGSWSEEPRCIREEECGAFPSVHHGKLQQTKQTYNDGDKTEFKCDPGFKPTPRFIRCVSGTWETPVCEVDVRCDIPPKVENAFITSKPEEFYGDGSNVTYACRSSFSLNGKSTVFCRSGTWEEAPRCEEVMCVANLTANMRSNVTKDGHRVPEFSVRPGDTITLNCVGKGVKLQGEREITCQSNGQWSSPFPKCEAETTDETTCPQNTTDEDLKMERFPDIRGPIKTGHKLIFSCNREGLKLEGDKEITCQSNGEWSSPFPTCEELICVANLTDNMRSNVTDDKHPGPEFSVRPGDTITLKCVEGGVKLQGHSKITCLSDGQWKVPFPKCVGEGMCPLNTTDEDIIMERSPDIEGPVKPGHKLIFSCNGEGLKLKGQKEITCLPNGEWNSPFPKCEEVMCVANLTANMRSNVTKDGRRVPEFSVRPGDTINLNCVGKKVKLQGEKEITCQSNGQWNSPFPKCEAKTTDDQLQKKMKKSTEFSV